MSIGLLLLFGCSGDWKENSQTVYPGDEQKPSIFGPDGLVFEIGEEKSAPDPTPQIGVNSLLWRASLDTLSFMPLSSADSSGGVILTDWYSFAEFPNERFKVNLYILDSALRADALRTVVFRQTQDGEQWKNASVSKNTVRRLKDVIFARARQLNIESTP